MIQPPRALPDAASTAEPECFVVLDLTPRELMWLEACAAGAGLEPEVFAAEVVRHALRRVTDMVFALPEERPCH